MQYRYQLIILGRKTDIAKSITDLFFVKIKELKLAAHYFVIIDEVNFSTLYKGNQPAFALYIGDDGFKNVNILEKLIEDGTTVLPIFHNSFNEEIPPILNNQNGLQFKEKRIIKIVNLALESFQLLRSTRKVFVSYRRNESTSVAIQLYEALERNNFDVFLDTHSIKQGEPFQEELWHRMADCDVIILLNTPGFLESYWCKEEIAEASAKQIGVLQLVWPNHKLESMAHVCFPINMKNKDFIDDSFTSATTSRLTEEKLASLVEQVESLRARNLASRQDNLISEFINLATKCKKEVNLQPERFITEDLKSGKRRIFIPTVGVPQSITCNQSEELLQEMIEHDVDSIFILYDDLRLRDKWLSHLDWLNGQLSVKTIKKQEFEIWLQKN